MGTTNINSLIDDALQSMRESGAGARSLRGYEHTGFGAIRRHFEAVGVLEYDRDVVGALVRDLRGRAERGEVSMWKWRLVRRAAAILEALSETGLVDVPALTPWCALRPAPTADEQADRDNLHALVWNTQQALKASGLSAKTLAMVLIKQDLTWVRFCS